MTKEMSLTSDHKGKMKKKSRIKVAALACEGRSKVTVSHQQGRQSGRQVDM